ncbi:hypothetical protein [Verrucomicrobium sp. BvORR106]|uniref:hypothetical protein n=1 Tax=Verrucomicrobium sp. BvORR106 TaxID=1403819 RepID=UPI00056EA1CA|nr:hypothetical protein [Verrucomicrobium sp. BvORR106]
MARSYKDIAQELRDSAAVELSSKGTTFDRLYTEQETIPRTKANPKYPAAASQTVPAKCIPGAVHPKCTFLILVDAYSTGGDDSHDNWVLLYRLDLQAFCLAFPEVGTWPNLLAKDGATITDEYSSVEPLIEWRFDVVNPDSYTKPPKGTAHPLITQAKLTKEIMVRRGPLASIIRVYETLAEAVDYEYDPETLDRISISRQIVPYSTPAATQPVGHEITYKELGSDYQLKVDRSIGTSPTGYSTATWATFVFPTVVINHNFGSGVLIGDRYVYHPRIRAGFRKRARGVVEVSFHATQPSPTSLYQIVPEDVVYQGVLFDVEFRSALVDGATLSTSGPLGSESVTYADTSPSASAYLAAIGTQVTIAEQISRWRYGLWRRELLKITLE